MNDSSSRHSSILAAINARQVQFLLDIVSRSSLPREEYITQIYSDQAEHFSETVIFLKDINWMRQEQGQLVLTPDGAVAAGIGNDELQIREKLAESLAREGCPYQAMLADYLTQFTVRDEKLVHRPDLSKRLREGPLRNVLMDLHVVTYQAKDDSYALNGLGIDLHMWARNVKGAYSRVQFAANRAEREELGSAAELAVLEYERKRVGAQWASAVEHVSAKYPYACYDIQSVTLKGNTGQRRYIEVKAVARESQKFYWTSGELDAAKVLRGRYFLYLIPVVAARGFDLDSMVVVADPWVAVYKDQRAWLIEENIISCRRR